MCFRTLIGSWVMVWAFIVIANAQTSDDFLMEQLIELLAEELEEDFDFSQLLEQLDHYRKYPINLNQTDGSELRDLPFLPPLFVDNLLDHRGRSGDFISVLELQTIVGIDRVGLQLLLPLVSVDERNALRGVRGRQLLHEGSHDVMVRYGRFLQQQRGYAITDTSRSRYLGSPDRLFVRYRYQFSNDLQVAVNMKKDAGEQFFAGGQPYGFDFYSASLHVRNQGRIKDIVVGDYALQFGQGLAMWSGLSFGKGALLQNVAKQAAGLRPYTSTNEVLFLRGASTTVGFGRFSVTPFVSWRRLDGAVRHGDDSIRRAGSLGQTGLHRTPTEQANRNALQQWVFGTGVRYQRRRLTLGATVFKTQFDADIVPQPLLRNQYAFSGSSLWNASLYYSTSISNVYVFGEAAHLVGGGFALLNGLAASLHPQLSFVLLHRRYDKDYHSFFGQGLAEGSQTANENGWYSGLAYHPNRRVEWVVYADFFRFPWLRYRVDAPSQGVDMLSQFSYTWYKRASVTIRYRYRNKQENAAMDLPENTLSDVYRHQLRLEGRYQVNEGWSMRNRLEMVHYRKAVLPTEVGWMAYHDVIYKPMASKLSGNVRLAVFGTPSYHSRIYAYENDVLFANSFPIYHNRGIRTYINVRYRFWGKFDLWLRYATFVYQDVSEVGSGLDAIDGRQRSDVRVQFRWQF